MRSIEYLKNSLIEIRWFVFAGLFLIVLSYLYFGFSYEILLRLPFFVLTIFFIYEFIKRLHFPRRRSDKNLAALTISLLLTYLTPTIAILFLLVIFLAFFYFQRTQVQYQMNRICPNCRREVGSRESFCPYCSYSLRTQVPRSPTPSSQTQSNLCPICKRNRLRTGQDICDQCANRILGQ